MTKPLALIWMLGMLAVSSACTGYQVVPDHLKNRIQTDVSYEQIKKTPQAYAGRTVMWGGKVLGVTQTEQATRVELLHVPMDEFYRPIDAPTASEGRFLAVDGSGEMKDPSLLQNGTLVTVIGEVRGDLATPAQGSSEYPTLMVQDMTAWDKERGVRHTPPGSPLTGWRPFVFWDGRRM